jgi:hypothetical protein
MGDRLSPYFHLSVFSHYSGLVKKKVINIKRYQRASSLYIFSIYIMHPIIRVCHK